MMFWKGVDFMKKCSKSLILKIIFCLCIFWYLFYELVFPLAGMFLGYDFRMVAFRYQIQGNKYDGNFIDDFRRGFSLHPGYAIQFEYPMIYYYGKEGFVVLNQESPEIKILKAENPNYSRYLWENNKYLYVRDVRVYEKVDELTAKEQEIYRALKNSKPMEFPRFKYPSAFNIIDIYKNIQIPRPREKLKG